MPHRHHHTESFVLGSWPFREGGLKLDLLTEDLGRVLVVAQGARQNNSKLRYHLTQLGFFRASLVRGREFWRLVGAEPGPLNDQNLTLAEHRHWRILLAKLALVLRRFLVSNVDYSEVELYGEIRKVREFVSKKNFLVTDLEKCELILMWRVLSCLGYVNTVGDWQLLLKSRSWSQELISLVSKHRLELIDSINEALYHSHL